MRAFKTLLRDLSLNSWGIMKVGCIGRDIDGVQLTTSSLFGDDGVVTFTSRLLPTVLKRVLCKHVKGTVNSDWLHGKDCHLFFVFPPCVKIGRC